MPIAIGTAGIKAMTSANPIRSNQSGVSTTEGMGYARPVVITPRSSSVSEPLDLLALHSSWHGAVAATVIVQPER